MRAAFTPAITRERMFVRITSITDGGVTEGVDTNRPVAGAAYARARALVLALLSPAGLGIAAAVCGGAGVTT